LTRHRRKKTFQGNVIFGVADPLGTTRDAYKHHHDQHSQIDPSHAATFTGSECSPGAILYLNLVFTIELR
jgi:hypothetical protein